MLDKFCPRCKTIKLISEFYAARHRKSGLQGECKTCVLDRAKSPEGKKSRRDHKSKNFSKYSLIEKIRKIKDRYGLTVERYLSFFDLQEDKCLNPRCQTFLEPYTKNSCIDHNHDTGVVRGLLCQKCNVNLGWFENNKDWIESYLGVKWQKDQSYPDLLVDHILNEQLALTARDQ